MVGLGGVVTIVLVSRTWWMWMLTKRPRLGPWQCWATLAIDWCARPTSRNSSGRWKLSTGWALGTLAISVVVVLWKSFKVYFFIITHFAVRSSFFFFIIGSVLCLQYTVFCDVLGANTCWWFARQHSTEEATLLSRPDTRTLCAQCHDGSCMDLFLWNSFYKTHLSVVLYNRK